VECEHFIECIRSGNTPRSDARGETNAGHAIFCAGAWADRLAVAASSGGTIVLSGMCPSSYTLPSGATFTLEGAPGTTSGFDGVKIAHGSIA
jgi:hypothetical protein